MPESGPWYQIVAFFDCEPAVGQTVYEGPGGWLPQVAIRRRFRHADEANLLTAVTKIAHETLPFAIEFGRKVRPQDMPVDVIEVQSNSSLRALHMKLFEALGQAKFPDREGAHYVPHMTASWQGRAVVDATRFIGVHENVEGIWLIKDEGSDSVVLKRFGLGS